MKAQNPSLDSVARKKYWREGDAEIVVAAWSDSGQPQIAFARQHSIHVGRLRRWAKRIARLTAPTFHPVELVLGSPGPDESPSDLELVLRGGRRVSIGPGFDPDLLKRLVQAVESWSC